MKEFCKKIVVRIITWEAKMLLRRTRPKVIAVTGNVGKTSTKDAIYTVLKDHVRARKSEKSFNSEIGVPLSVLGLENAWSDPVLWLKNIIDGLFTALLPGEYPNVLVLEVGVDRPGDMKELTAWLKPDVVVITRLPDVPVHVEYFSSPEEVVAEKLQLLDALKSDGVFVYNHDDERVRQVAEETRQHSIGYSRYSPSHFTASGDQISYQGNMPVGLEFDMSHLDTTERFMLTDSIGMPHIYAYAAAAAVGSLFDVTLSQARKALCAHTPTPGRMRVIAGLKDTVILDDTYNSSPTAAERALSSLKEVKGKRKVAVLGDMLELGQFSVREHERVGEQVAECADVLVTVGVRSRKIAEGALEHGFSEKNIFQYDEINRAQAEVQNMLQPGDVVLVKASQGIRGEKLVEEIMAEPERAEELLVRQSQTWKRR